jgi:L-amino acid N-acyltransferase YncA
MEKKVKLKDGSQILIRVMQPADADRSYDFFASLSDGDRKYLRVDVTQREVVERRIRDIEDGRVVRLVALDQGKIVADGALELSGHGWGPNVAEIRLIVSGTYQQRGLGSVLMRELHFLAAEHKVDRIVARFMAPQRGARHILTRLGFRDEFVIPDQVRDMNGHWQDLVIMRCNLEDLWQEMERSVELRDWAWPV